MASYNFTRPTSFPAISPFDKVGTGDPVPTLKKFFLQRAWNTVWLAYETWTSEDAPDPNPPSGDPITGLTTAAYWKAVV